MNALRACVVVLALAAGAPVFAQAAKPQPQPQPASNEIAALFAAWDADHNGVLSQQEFRGGWNTLRQQAESRVEARLRDQFDKVDGNHDGAIDAGEYGNLLLIRQAGKSAPPLSAFDANHDQRLQFGEYLALVRGMAAQAARAKASP